MKGKQIVRWLLYIIPLAVIMKCTNLYFKSANNIPVAIHEKPGEVFPFNYLDKQRTALPARELIDSTWLQGHDPAKVTRAISVLEDDIFLHYPPFNYSLPRFGSDTDKRLFLLNRDNIKLLNGSSNKNSGVIRVIYGAKVDKSLTCHGEDLLQFVDKDVVETGGGAERPYDADILVPLLVPDAYSFQHFLDGVLPKLAHALPFLRTANASLALYKPRDRIIEHILHRLGVLHRVLWVEGDRTLRARFAVNVCQTPAVHPAVYAETRALLGADAGMDCGGGACSGSKVVLLNRAGSHNGGRNIQNQREVIAYLKQRYPGEFTLFRAQKGLASARALFSRARLIIGVHGGALYNVNLAPRHCHVVELMPTQDSGAVSRRLAHTIVWQMSSAARQTYWRLALPPIDDADNVALPLDRLAAVLDQVEDARRAAGRAPGAG